ncbi:hypothetical protein BJ741DRAFT_586556 [Chytriomyces cf. hyalinus JEL632]|nr:hypothetical protein BJ741DRAFT_586556 [Chytriomyces cf. hyalinus JEL632]
MVRSVAELEGHYKRIFERAIRRFRRRCSIHFSLCFHPHPKNNGACVVGHGCCKGNQDWRRNFHHVPESHVLMHVLVGTDEDGLAYQVLVLDLASKYVLRKTAPQMIMNLQDMIAASTQEISRRLFEIYGHRNFSSRGSSLFWSCLSSWGKLRV